jgi:hypothetical protein
VVRKRILTLATVLIFAGCAGSPPAEPLKIVASLAPTVGPTEQPTEAASPSAVPTSAPTAQVTDLPTELPTAQATEPPTEQPTDAPSLQPTPKPAYYTPPGWDGFSDVNCPDFKTHAEALSFFIGTGGTKTNDPYRLDTNHDGNPCQSLP